MLPVAYYETFRDSMSLKNHGIIMGLLFCSSKISWIGFSPFGKSGRNINIHQPSTYRQPTSREPRFRISSQSLKNIEGFKSWPSTPSMLLEKKSQNWRMCGVFSEMGKVRRFPGLPFLWGQLQAFWMFLVSEPKVGL